MLFSTLMEPIRLAVPSIAYNERYLKDYAAAPGLMPNIISSETPYKDICKCNPGTWLRITKDEVCENHTGSLPIPKIPAGVTVQTSIYGHFMNYIVNASKIHYEAAGI